MLNMKKVFFDPFNNVYKDPIFSELGSRKFIEKEPTLGKAIAPSSL